jgi:hypothetical protein
VYRNISLTECNVMQYRRFDGPSNLHPHSCDILNVPPIRILVTHFKASRLFFSVYLNLDNWNYILSEASTKQLCLVSVFKLVSSVLTAALC